MMTKKDFGIWFLFPLAEIQKLQIFVFSFQYVFIVSLSGQELAPSPKPIGGLSVGHRA
jgi:hypothetical protein